MCKSTYHTRTLPIQAEPEETLVVLLFGDPITGRHSYVMAKDCYRITYEELKDLYTLSEARACTHARKSTYGHALKHAHTRIDHKTRPQAGPGQGIPVSFGPDAPLLFRQPLKPAQRTKAFRSSLAYGLAMDRLVPEQQRRVLITAPCTNDNDVPNFDSTELQNLITPEVCTCMLRYNTQIKNQGAHTHRHHSSTSIYPTPNPQLEADESFQPFLPSLRAGLDKIAANQNCRGGAGA